ncbi:MAG: hypothetical protein M1834_003519 [Cirrosporium novae-zelandiae]|nr:MAG: hypothetical protein M1834_003519 [Cirrosporium novae-zelandiae]
MDPFCRLPWFILKDTLSLLPDLPTLHRLVNASPAVAAFLRQENSFFPEIVEAILSHPIRDKGLLPWTRFLLRTMVFIWWRTYLRHSNSESDTRDNPLPSSYHAIISYFYFYTLDDPIQPIGYGTVPLPRSTPCVVLFRLLAFSTRLRQITHACFHGLISRCMALKPERMETPDTEYNSFTAVVDQSFRPAGRPFSPVDIGPPSWAEEQRLTKAVLRVSLFFELRKAAVTHGSLNIGIETIQRLQIVQVKKFWGKILFHRNEVEEFRTVMMWLSQETGGVEGIESWMVSSLIPENLIYCCPELPSLPREQLSRSESSMLRDVPGIIYSSYYRSMRHSPLRCVSFKVFRPFGFGIWDEKRMIALGFLNPPTKDGKPWASGPHDTRLRFTWSSILTQSQWEEVVELQSWTRRI